MEGFVFNIVTIVIVTVAFVTVLGLVTGRNWPYSLYLTTILAFWISAANALRGEWVFAIGWFISFLLWSGNTILWTPRQFEELNKLHEKRKNETLNQQITTSDHWFGTN